MTRRQAIARAKDAVEEWWPVLLQCSGYWLPADAVYLRGGLCIHPCHGYYGDWTITHPGSGLAVSGPWDNLNDTLEIAGRLLALPVDWSKTKEHYLALPRDLRKLIDSIRRREPPERIQK